MRLPFAFMGKQLTEAHIQSLLKKGETAEIKGFVNGTEKVNGKLKLNTNFEMILG
jgi:DNA topoisomerase-3